MIVTTTHGAGIDMIGLMIAIPTGATMGVTIATTTIATRGAMEIAIATPTNNHSFVMTKEQEHSA
jgi:hypothetical protein